MNEINYSSKHISDILHSIDNNDKKEYNNYIHNLGCIMVFLCYAMEYLDMKCYDTAFYLASFACQLAIQNNCTDVYAIIHAIKQEIASSENKNEYHYQLLFKQYASKIFHNCRIIHKKTDPHNQPDAWVEINGEEIPVEVKLADFNKSALKQLNRYMLAFKCYKGIAVARTLSIELPKNIIFVSNDTLDELDGELERKSNDNYYLSTIKNAFNKPICNDDK